MHDVKIALEILEDNVLMPMGHRKGASYLVLDVKIDFTRKAQWVLDRNKTPSSTGESYSMEGSMR